MDDVHERSKWRRKCIPWILFLIAFLRQADALEEHTNVTGVICAENEYLNGNGICCDKCSPGFKLTQECGGHGLRSTCIKCSDGTYLDSINYFRNCFRCLECKRFASVKFNCTHDRNTVCECKSGYFMNVYNSNTVLCKRCNMCGDGERVQRECTQNNDTICVCKDSHYRENRKTCAPCKECTESCSHLCLAKATESPVLPTILIPILGATTILTIVIFVSYEGIRRWRKKSKHQLSPESPDRDMTKPIYSEENEVSIEDKEEKNAPLTEHCVDLEHVLPDCVPREIKTHEFIYFALDVVPVKRFKELVRNLNVSEQDIDRAERDNRAFADAQYQMLKVWSDNGAGGGKNILSRSLLQEFVDVLKDMNLSGCAESIESKFCSDV